MRHRPLPQLGCSYKLDVANVFNLVLRRVIFQELCVASGGIMQLIPFIRAFYAFYAFEYLLFYNHHNHEGDVIVIPFAMGICLNNPLEWALYALTHFRVLNFIANHFPSCLFPSIIDDTHITGPLFIVSCAYEHFQTKLYVIGLPIQLHKCVRWSPSGLSLNFNTSS